jgi:TIR domain
MLSMRVFISFSGDRSAAVASAVRDWLPNVIQATDPWMSQTDIPKGTRWTTEVSGILADAAVGIICVTPENVNEPWIAFEAGALSKAISSCHVCPYLFDMKPANLPYPLAMFQYTTADKKDTRTLVHSINAALGAEALEDQRLDKIFDTWWPSLEAALSRIPSALVNDKSVRPDRELLEEVLSLMRSQINEKRDQEMLMRIQSFNAVLTELARTVQSSGRGTPEVDRRFDALRGELEQASKAFNHIFGLMDNSRMDNSRYGERPAAIEAASTETGT